MPSRINDSGPANDGAGPPRILFIDAYDSFTCNITDLLHKTLGPDTQVHVIHMDLKSFDTDEAHWKRADFVPNLSYFDAVICGPGPGSPENAADVGVFRDLWTLAREDMVPVLGICLGFQSLVASFGGRVRKLRRGLHGMVRDIEHGGPDQNGDIFAGVAPFKATLYHSLCADLVDSPGETSENGGAGSDILPLAWTTEVREDGAERILMAVKHRSKPFWGLQYHPESVCTEGAAHKVIQNWFEQARRWNVASGRKRAEIPSSLGFAHASPSLAAHQALLRLPEAFKDFADAKDTYSYTCLDLPPGVDTVAIAEILGLGTGDMVVLDSSSARKADPLAKMSVLAVGLSSALRFEYRAQDSHLSLIKGNHKERVEFNAGLTNPHRQSIWIALAAFQQRKGAHLKHIADLNSCRFKGGFMGYLTYEMGLNSLSPEEMPRRPGPNRPDLCMAWVQRSIVVDHKANKVYVQALENASTGDTWIEETAKRLQHAQAWTSSNGTHNGATPHLSSLQQKKEGSSCGVRFATPDPMTYEDNVRRCKHEIAEGNSYELCLTAQTTMARPKSTCLPRHLATEPPFAPTQSHPASWDIYKELRNRQPAPFGSFIRLGGANLLSSSPERFLSIDTRGVCEMRPMKGTVRKSETVKTLADAEKLLHIPKEEAENLMIVDLVRHDLHRICGPGKVAVPELMKVEEYESVFTMITAVEAQVPRYQSGKYDSSPFAVLDTVFPPGSMTGAPKKRSCELLRGIETCERSLYSGVVGYFDVTGNADWSVTIRSMFRWDDEDYEEPVGEDATGQSETRETWHIGAGGAVTILSTPKGELDEMLTKLRGPLGVFVDTA